ncbi:hypothetical protein [Nocardioides xinjiangensis]|uniref:hypothetical protein n=1 Tax=Nocardioides xinjiangensis TaxID=2817376 RepID=UPI001B3072D9|nr:MULTISPECIES: hypothetical protein [unclassified Nocardioides]
MDATTIDQVLGELAEVPVAPGDAELAAVAIAVHLEEALGVTVPADLLDAAHLVPPAALERTVRRLVAGP